MPDTLEKELAERLPDLTAEVRKAVEAPAQIDTFLRVESSPSTTPWRGRSPRWDTDPPVSGGSPVVRNAIVDVERAREVVAVYARLPETEWDECLEELRTRAREVGEQYRLEVLNALKGPPAESEEYSPDSVIAKVSEPGRWRVYGPAGPLARVSEQGLADLIDAKGGLKDSGLRALVVSSIDGPVVTQLDVPVLTWELVGDRGVRFTVTRRFFFKPGVGTVVFTRAPGSSTA